MLTLGKKILFFFCVLAGSITTTRREGELMTHIHFSSHELIESENKQKGELTLEITRIRSG